jgi:uncharacterized sulfatase
MGDPLAVTDDRAPSQKELETNTRVAFADMDAGPTKAWLVAHRNDPKWKWHYDYAFGKRPAEELYDVKADPDQIRNVAGDPKYADALKKMSGRLTEILTEAGDPRVKEADCRFDRAPFAGPGTAGKKK